MAGASRVRRREDDAGATVAEEDDGYDDDEYEYDLATNAIDGRMGDEISSVIAAR